MKWRRKRMAKIGEAENEDKPGMSSGGGVYIGRAPYSAKNSYAL